MRLRQKTAWIIFTTVLGLVGALYLVSYPILAHGFDRMEEAAAREQLGRVRAALAYLLDELESRAGDWANSDDTCAFLADGNSEYARKNLTAEALTTLRVNYVALLKPAGEAAWAGRCDLKTAQVQTVPRERLAALTADGHLLERARLGAVSKGLLPLPDGNVLLVVRPILPSAGKGAARGALLMARYLDGALLDRVGQMTGRPLQLQYFSAPGLPEDMRAALFDLGTERPDLIRPLSEEAVAGYALLPDITGSTTLLARVEIERDIHRQGRTSLLWFAGALLLVGLVFGVVALLVTEKLVLSRLARLDRQVRAIGLGGEPGRRLELGGRDELSHLVEEMNRMLERFERAEHAEASRQRLVLLGELAAGVAHEFRNPLHGVLNCIELLRKQPQRTPADQELLDLAEEGLRRMDAISERMLRLGRERPETRQPVDAAGLIEGTLAFVRARAEKVGVALEVTTAPDLPPLFVDGPRVSEALLNLLTNSLDATPRGGTIRVAARRAAGRPEMAELSVADTGTGIPPEVQSRLFSPFFTTKPAGEGAGLGLALTRRIAELHGGGVELESAPGRGTTVRLILPLAPTAAEG